VFSYVGGCVLFAAVLHATWNAMLHGNRDRFLSLTWMSIGIALIAAAFIPFVAIPNRAAWSYILVSGLIHIVYNISLVRAYRTGDLGETYPIARGSSPVLVALGAGVFAQEHLSPVHALGVVLVSCGIISLALQRGRITQAGTVAALITGLTIAVYSVIDGIGVRLAGSAVSYTAWVFLFYGLMPVLFIARRGPRALRVPAADIRTAFLGGGASVAAYGIVIWAMQGAAMGAVSALRETSVLFAALIGRIFLKESLTPWRLVSCAVIAVGAVLIGS
jgi:drug/metabolite transporter (DMT)-like permease